MRGCVGCDLAKGFLPSVKLYEDELTETDSNRLIQVLRTLGEVYDFDGYSVIQNGRIFNEFTHYHYHIGLEKY